MRDQHILFLEKAQQAALQRRHVVLPPPNVEPLHDVFAEAMLEHTSARQQRSPLDWAVSLAAHFAILMALLVLPLYFTSGLDVQRFNLTFLATPLAPPAAPPPAPLSVSAAPRAVRNLPIRAYTPGKLTAPSFIPRTVSLTAGEILPPEVAPMGVIGGVPGGISGGEWGGVQGGAFGGMLRSVPAPPAAEGPRKPLEVGGRVKPPRLIYGPDAEYPVLARMSRISGIVIVEAIIDENGKVTGVRAISGHPLLIPAALTAVSRRIYEPTVLDGDPVPIDLRVEVSFKVG